MKLEQFNTYLDNAFGGFDEFSIPSSIKHYTGKVRDVFDLGDELLLVTSDRISAFDRGLGALPLKGEILNQLALSWFKQTDDIITNHLVQELTPRSVVVKKCEVLPVEVIVRGYLTGSAWRDYTAGNPISGITLPEGMKNNQKFDTPIITPSTKAEIGDHDMPISSEEIVAKGLVEESIWNKVYESALALFQRGTEIAAKQGLILVDTKYEFGMYKGELIIVDEIHTPDSSRFWYADSYEENFSTGVEQRKLDKEFLRQWLLDQGFSGQGAIPEIPRSVLFETLQRYIEAFEGITGNKFNSRTGQVSDELNTILNFLQTRS